MTTSLEVTVVGAGAGGLALAAGAALGGARVTILDTDEARCAPIQQCGAIEVVGEPARAVAVATTDAAQALAGADLVLLAVLPRDLPTVMRSLADHFAPGTHVLVSQSHFGGAFTARTALGARAAADDITIGESASYPYACVSDRPGSVRIIATKRHAPVAALPARRTAEFARRAAAVIPAFTPAASVMHTSLSDVSASIHAPTMIANAGRIESGVPFDFFADGMTESVARLVYAYDAERVSLANALGVTVPTVAEWVESTYAKPCRSSADLSPVLHGVFGASMAPTTITHRYLAEDIACLTVPTCAVADMVGVDVPIHRALVDVASQLCGEDFLRTGRTAHTLGIDRLSTVDLRQLVEGEVL